MIENNNSHPPTPGAGAGSSENPTELHQTKGHTIIVDNEKIVFLEPEVSGQAILEKANKLPITCYTLYIKLENCDFEKISLEQIVDLRKPIEHFVTKEPDVFPYKVNKDPELTTEKFLTAEKIILDAGLNPEKVYLIENKQDGEEIIFAFKPHDPIQMHCKGLHFITKEWMASVDIEEYGKTCQVVPPARIYLIKVDKEKFPWSHPTIRPEEIIKFVVKDNPANYNLIKFYSNTAKPVTVPFTSIVDLTEKCLLRFVVQPKTQNDGLRSQFSLPEEEGDFLNAMGFQWETLKENQYLWLLINDFIIPIGYQIQKCQLALMIPPSYPATEIDMAYFYPSLVKDSRRPINATTNQLIDQKVFQRWSRHRKPGDWKPGVDNISTHLVLVNNWLTNELTR